MKISTGVVILMILLLFWLAPLATIWAMNTLFPVLMIPYTFWTWLAVIVLASAIHGNVTNKK
jgi:tryptophan-rich sensory protein